MNRSALIMSVAGLVVMGASAPAWASVGGPEGHVRSAEDLASPRIYIDDPDYPLFYATAASSGNCGSNPACDIDVASFMVSATSPDEMTMVALMTGPTDQALSNSDEGGFLLLIDSDDDRSDWEYRMWTRTMVYPLKQAVESTISAWDGDSWEPTSFRGEWYRSDEAWLATIPWKAMGITSFSGAVRASDAAGQEDYAPDRNGTPVIPIAALVAGAPGQPKDLAAKPGAGQVTLTWTAPTNPGTSAIMSYSVVASPSGATCTSSTTTCTVTGLPGGVQQSFTVTATNGQGTGPASDAVTATPTAAALTAPTNVKATYKAKGAKGTATVTWARPAGATSMEVRWALNGGAFTPWKTLKANKVTVPGLTKGKTTVFEVRGANASGPGAAATIRLALK